MLESGENLGQKWIGRRINFRPSCVWRLTRPRRNSKMTQQCSRAKIKNSKPNSPRRAFYVKTWKNKSGKLEPSIKPSKSGIRRS